MFGTAKTIKIRDYIFDCKKSKEERAYNGLINEGRDKQ